MNWWRDRTVVKVDGLLLFDLFVWFLVCRWLVFLVRLDNLSYSVRRKIKIKKKILCYTVLQWALLWVWRLWAKGLLRFVLFCFLKSKLIIIFNFFDIEINMNSVFLSSTSLCIFFFSKIIILKKGNIVSNTVMLRFSFWTLRLHVIRFITKINP